MITDAEIEKIDAAVRRVGGGVLLRAELVTWAFYVRESGDPIERDTLALFMAGELRPEADLDREGLPVFVPAERPVVVECQDDQNCILDDGHASGHARSVG